MTRLIDGDMLISKISITGFPNIDRNGRIDKSCVYELINSLPTLAERPKGKWIHNELGYLICSNCGYDCLYDEEGLYSLGCFCHHCGADMRGDKNEKDNL